MALTVTLAQVNPSAIANQATGYVVTVASDAAAPVSLQSLAISVEGATVAFIEQPNFLVPNMPVGLGNPSIGAASSVSYGFKVMWNAPRTPGPSPQTPPIPSTGMMVGQPALPSFVLQARAATSDGSSGLANLTVPVLSAVPIFPRPEGGATVFTQGNNANLIAALF